MASAKSIRSGFRSEPGRSENAHDPVFHHRIGFKWKPFSIPVESGQRQMDHHAMPQGRGKLAADTREPGEYRLAVSTDDRLPDQRAQRRSRTFRRHVRFSQSEILDSN